MGEHEGLLFFGEDGVGVPDALDVLAVWFFLDGGAYFAVAGGGRERACGRGEGLFC